MRGHLALSEMLHQAGSDINSRSSLGYTPLMGASDNNHPQLVEWLCELQADVNAANNDGDTALHSTVLHNQNEVVKSFLKYRADLISNSKRKSPIDLSIDIIQKEV